MYAYPSITDNHVWRFFGAQTGTICSNKSLITLRERKER
jgi:hypothetical protein